MALYRDRLCPCLTHLAMSMDRLRPYRERIVAPARGRVLEIGVGSGSSLDFYSDEVGEIVGLDPSPAMLGRARARRT